MGGQWYDHLEMQRTQTVPRDGARSVCEARGERQAGWVPRTSTEEAEGRERRRGGARSQVVASAVGQGHGLLLQV